MKTVKSTCTDSELSEAVAVHVAGWAKSDHPLYWHIPSEGTSYCGEPDFATDANAVLPLLDKNFLWQSEFVKKHYISIQPEGHLEDRFIGRHESFARAACFALLSSKGLTIDYTPTPDATKGGCHD